MMNKTEFVLSQEQFSQLLRNLKFTEGEVVFGDIEYIPDRLVIRKDGKDVDHFVSIVTGDTVVRYWRETNAPRMTKVTVVWKEGTPSFAMYSFYREMGCNCTARHFIEWVAFNNMTDYQKAVFGDQLPHVKAVHELLERGIYMLVADESLEEILELNDIPLHCHRFVESIEVQTEPDDNTCEWLDDIPTEEEDFPF